MAGWAFGTGRSVRAQCGVAASVSRARNGRSIGRDYVPRRVSDALSRLHRVLRRLRIENLVLIREAELEFAPGLNVITGETGAGKTIFAQAVGLLLGAKGDDGLVGPHGAEAYVEAELDADDALADLRPEDADA